MASGQVLHTLTGPIMYVTSVAFSLDGRTLASGNNAATSKLWDMASGQLLGTLRSHVGLALSPDGRTLASGGYDNAIELWDVSNVNEAGK